MVTTSALIAYIEQLSGHALNRDEGVQHGSAERPVRHVVVCWMATVEALAFAGQQGADLVIAHESLYYPYDAYVRSDVPPDWPSWEVNRRRRELLDRHDLVLLRAHGSLDDICIFDDFAALLGLAAPVEEAGLVKVYEIEPCSLASLVERVKAATGMPAVRVCSPRGLDQVAQRVGLPWGGLGLFVNVSYQQQLIERHCDVMIAGESDNYGFRFAGDLGIPTIETGHEISENPGLAHFAEMLRARFSELQVSYYECPPAWQWA